MVTVEHAHIDQTRDAHAQVIAAFQGHSDKQRQRISAHLNTLRVQRNTADYDLVTAQAMDTYTAHDCIDLAEEILAILKSL